MAQKHYNGFSNSVLWPLLHGMPDKSRADSTWSEAYQEVNEIFADNPINASKRNSLCWDATRDGITIESGGRLTRRFYLLRTRQTQECPKS
jgi:Glycosyltransferase family 20